MKSMCRDLPVSRWQRATALQKICPHARTITDPKKLAQLQAAAKRNAGRIALP
jgi:hypothetical protein